MLNFSFCSPTKFVFGKGMENSVGELISDLKATKVLIHYGEGSVVRSGLLDRVKASLVSKGIQFVELGGVKPNPRAEMVYKGIEMAKVEKVDFILAVGGGSVIDSAKSIAAGALYDGDFWDIILDNSIMIGALPVGCVLTIPAAGSEGSPISVITKEDEALKRRIRHESLRPAFAVLNPELTATLPDYQIACGAVDIMAHIMERYFSNTEGVDLSDRLCESVLVTIVKAAPELMKDRNNYDAAANMMWAGTLAHNGLCGMGRQEDWGSHDIEHELSGLYDVAHGAGLAVIFPAWMKYVYKANVMKFAQFAFRVFGCQIDFDKPETTALMGIAKLEEFYRSLGLTTNLIQLGARIEDIPLLASKVKRNNGTKCGYFNPLDTTDIERIYEIACEQ